MMTEISYLTHAGYALCAIESGRLESHAENIVRLAAEQYGSHAKGEEVLARHFSMEQFDRFEEWFLNNYLHCQASFDANKYACVHDAGTREELVLFRFKTDGHVGAYQFNFPRVNPFSTIRTILSKDEPDESLSHWVMPNLVGVPALSLEECTSIAAMPRALAAIAAHAATSNRSEVRQIPVHILYRKGNDWHEVPM